MWRFLLSAITASAATFISWSILVDDNTLGESTSIIMFVAICVVIALAELVFSYFWSQRSAAKRSLVDFSISRNRRFSGLLYGTGFIAGAILTLIACLMYKHIHVWAHVISLVAFLVAWWGFDLYVRASLRRSFLLIGPYSPNLGDAEVGDKGSFGIDDPEGIDYGDVKIKQGDEIIKVISMGGWTIPIKTTGSNSITITGESIKTLLYGLVELDSESGEFILTHKGYIDKGLINVEIPQI